VCVCVCVSLEEGLRDDDVTNSDIVVGDTNEYKGTKLDCLQFFQMHMNW